MNYKNDTSYIKYNSKGNNKKYNMMGGGEVTTSKKIDELYFWGRQLMEHALFIHLLIVDQSIKERAIIIYKNWNIFLNKTFSENGIGLDNIYLTEDQIKKVPPSAVQNSTKLVDDLYNLENDLMKTISSGKWVGWAYPSLVKHFIEENNFLAAKLNGSNMSIEEEIKFYNKNGEDAAVTEKLLDPLELETAEKAHKLFILSTKLNSGTISPAEIKEISNNYNKNFNLNDKNDFLLLSEFLNLSLMKFFTEGRDRVLSNTIKGVVNIDLATHNLRETERALYCLDKLKKKN